MSGLPPPPSRSGRVWKIVLPIVILLAGVGVGVVVASDDEGLPTESATATGTPSPEPTRFAEAFEATIFQTADRITLEDEGTSIVADGPSSSAFSEENLYIDDLTRLFVQLDVPDYVIEQMKSTTALMGTREASWDGIEASWSYHPDNGLDVVLVDTEA
jgi:hypothetical protein